MRALLSTLSEEEVTRILHSPEETDTVQQRDSSTWYHKGPVALRDVRVAIADFSLKRAKERLQKVYRLKLISLFLKLYVNDSIDF